MDEEKALEAEGVEDVAQLPAYVLPSWAYQLCKWTTLVLLPLVAVAYPQLAAIWGWPLSDEVSQTASVAALVLGALVGVSQVSGAISTRKAA